MGHERRGAGHLRQVPSGSERADLDLAQAAGLQRVDPAPLGAVGIVAFTLCSPSRGPTSLISIVGKSGIKGSS